MSTRSRDDRPGRDRPDGTPDSGGASADAGGAAGAGGRAQDPGPAVPGRASRVTLTPEPAGHGLAGHGPPGPEPAGHEPAGHGPAVDPVEEAVRDALRRAAAGVRPSPWPAGAVLDRAARRRRARRLARTVPAVAAVLVCAGVAAVVRRDGPAGELPAGTTTGPKHSVTASVTASATPAAEPAIRVVAPGQAIDVHAGQRMKLERDRRCVSDGTGSWVCDSVVGPNQATDTVSSRDNGGTSTGVVIEPLYIGDITPARMTVTLSGTTFPVRIVTLPGHPGYAAGYTVVPPRLAPRLLPHVGHEVIKVYDARGTILASMGTPDDLKRPTPPH